MYKLHLILKYLLKRRIAWVSLIAVMLCTTMVLVVISVMGGWLDMFRNSFHKMSGDIIVQGKSITGFPYYEEMIDRIRQVPGVKAASPVLRTFGLAYLNSGSGETRMPVEVRGYKPDIVDVNGFGTTLHRQRGTDRLSFALRDDVDYRLFAPSRTKVDVTKWNGMIASAGVLGITKGPDGELQRPSYVDHVWMKLMLLPISPETTSVDLSSKVELPFWIVDDSRAGSVQYDSNVVYVDFDLLQKALDMDQRTSTLVLPDGTEREQKLPARTNDIQIAVVPGTNLDEVKRQVSKVVDEVVEAHGISLRYPLDVVRWEEVNAMWLGAIEKEKVLVVVLFAIISIVAIFLIFCIFYMIVVEKTRDIGIIKSVGATSNGVAGIFLGYGAAIGVVGAGLGLLAGYLIVRYINELHGWMGRAMGIQIYNPEVYMFDTIPNRLQPLSTVVIVGVAVIASILGAAVPAMRAARLHPVEALRWE